MRNEALEAFESRLGECLHAIDRTLEARHGETFRRHPARPAEGTTANPEYDGLFSLIANFSAGIGSALGPGYTLSLRISTLEAVPEEVRNAWEEEAMGLLREQLPTLFPNRALTLHRDKYGWKLHGDLSLN